MSFHDANLTTFWMAVATHLWQSTLVIAVLFLVAGAMRRAPARFLNAIWWLALAKLFLPLPLLGLLTRRAADAGPDPAASALLMPPSVVSATSTLLNPLEEVARRTAFSSAGADALALALTALWMAGATVVLFLWLRRVRTFAHAPSMPLAQAPQELRDRVMNALEDTDIASSALRITEQPFMPHVAGVMRPRIVLSSRVVRQLDARSLKAVILHEDAHRRRLDPARSAATALATIGFFFYPILWPLLRLLRETDEMSCDELVLERGVAPTEYASALARTLRIELELAHSGAALDRRSPSLLRKRLARLSQPWRCSMTVKHRVVVVLAIAGVLAISTLAPVQGIAKDAVTDASKSEEKPEIGKVTVLTQVPPEYPELARAADLEAFVFARITVGSDLKVVDASVEGMYVGKAPLERTDFNIKEAKKQLSLEDDLTAYRKTFAQATIDAVLQWKIRVEPAGSAEQGVEMVVPVQFKLDAEESKDTEQKHG